VVQLPEWNRLYVHLSLLNILRGSAVLLSLSGFCSSGCHSRKPSLHHLLSQQYIFLERFSQLVQYHLRSARWNHHSFRKHWRLSVPSLHFSKFHPEVQLLLRHHLCLRKRDHCKFYGYHGLRDLGECNELSMVLIPECKRLHLFGELHDLLYWRSMLLNVSILFPVGA